MRASILIRTVIAASALFVGSDAVASLGAQARRTLPAATDLFKEPGGVRLARISAAASVVAGAVRAGWTDVTIDGWIAVDAIRADAREGFDVAIRTGSSVPIRAQPGAGATVAMAFPGALFNRLETRGNAVHVRRTGVIARAALDPAASPPTSSSPKPVTPATPATAGPATTTVSAGATVAATPGGAAVATLEEPLAAQVVEHRGSWTRVRLDVWVPDASLGGAPSQGAITADAIRAAPDRYIGQTVEWTLQVLAVQKADELRPELPAGQPYVLMRGPLPQTAFVYLVVTPEQADDFRSMGPLARVRIRATIRNGRTRALPIPILTFVRQLELTGDAK